VIIFSGIVTGLRARGHQVKRFGYVLEVAAPHLPKVSRLLHAIDDCTSKAWIAVTLSIASVLALVVAFLTGFSSPAVTVVTAVIQVVTLILIFAVQHTQARDQKATHRKLDELISTIPTADRRFIRLEQATDDEINNSIHRRSDRRTSE
jgi:low affinity Fe/Cu permease